MLRPYQLEAIDAVDEAWNLYRSVLLVMATGTGKTFTASRIVHKRKDDGRILWLAHRGELLDQAADTLRERVGLQSNIEKAELRAPRESDLWGARPVVVASVPSMRGQRLKEWDPTSFGTIVIDEAHHAPAKTYRNILEHFTGAKVLGLTATPDRGDGVAMGGVFEHCAYEYDIRAGIRDGYLCSIQQTAVECSDLDISDVSTVAGDLNQGQLEQALMDGGVLHQTAAPLVELAGRRQTLVFTAGVAQAHALADVIAGYLGNADLVKALDGSTDKETRRSYIQGFREGRIQYLLNCAVLCLDEETEILTRRGFLGIDELSDDDEVANWDTDGSVRFATPQQVFRRPRAPGEQMVSVDSARASIRVTGGHRMVVKRGRKPWSVERADEAAGTRHHIPVSGVSAPANVKPLRFEVGPKVLAARVRGASYHYRKSGMASAPARQLAEERVRERAAMRYALPSELTLDECWLIGFWLGDGSVCDLQSGGREFTLSQSLVYPKIIARVDEKIEACGLDVRRREVEHAGIRSVRWSLARGTGFGPQKRNGVFHFEPYLDKSGADLLWGLSEDQFDSMLDGLWNADGNHGDGDNAGSRRIYGANLDLLSHLQAIASCRGYATALRASGTPKPGHRQLFALRYTKKASQELVSARLEVEDGWKDERVWCVKSDTGFIVTRRRGRVAVVGNCEGFDAPETSCVAVVRPTKSRALYAQMIGRGTRIADGKDDCLILDFTGNSGRHRLITPLDVLAGKPLDDDVLSDALGMCADGKPTEEALLAAEQRKREREEANAEARRRAQKIRAQVAYSTRNVDPFDFLGVKRDYRGGPATEKQLRFLRNMGVDVEEGAGRYECSRMIDRLQRRRSKKMCSYKQARLLARYGLPDDLSFKDAGEAITAIADPNQGGKWKVPDWVIERFVRVEE